MFAKRSTEGYVDALPGIKRKTLVFGENTLMTEFLLEKGSALPDHQHPQEQTGYLVSGRITLVISGQASDIVPGDSWCVPGGAAHSATALEDSVAIEVFAPVRNDYLPS